MRTKIDDIYYEINDSLANGGITKFELVLMLRDLVDELDWKNTSKEYKRAIELAWIALNTVSLMNKEKK